MDVLAVARRALETGPVCDACLGRCVADRSHGLTNHERGCATRVTIALSDDAPFEGRPDSCWVCEGICDRYDVLAGEATEALADREFGTYQVGTRLPAFVEENDRLLREDARGDPGAGESLKSECNREIGKRIGAETGATVDFERPDVVVLVDLERDDIEVTVNSAFVFGRYRKLERGIPQTRWPCSACDGSGWLRGEACRECGGTGYRYDRSVEQLIAPVVERAMGGSDATFHGAGREDVDARMLGTGRPFVVEVDSPRIRTPDLERLRTEINEEAEGAVEVEQLALATYEMVEHVKELDADKTYRADVTLAESVDRTALEDALARLSGASIAQRTPRRVAHRRAEIVRERTVHEARLIETNDRRATVEIRGAGGLYIKELLHGDDGRTEPSLAGLLGVPLEVDALDVVAVEAANDERFATDRLLR